MMTTTTTTRPGAGRLGGIAGLAFTAGVLLQNGVLLAGVPAPDAGVGEIRRFYLDHGGRVEAAVGLVAVNVVLLVAFAAVAATRLGDDTRGAVPARAVVPAAGLLAGSFLVTTALQAFLVARADTLDDALLQAFWDLHTTAFAMSAPALALVLGALAAGSLVTGRVLPRWTAVVALVGAVALVAAGLLAAGAPEGGPGLVLQLLGFGLWLVTLVTASIGLLRGR